MKKFSFLELGRSISVWFVLAALFGAVSVASGQQEGADGGGDAAPAADAEQELVVPKSVFVVEPRDKMPKEGIDPFFPKSKRRDPVPKGPTPEEIAAAKAAAAAAAAAKKEEAPPPPPDPFDDLTLKGVIGGRVPMATINTSVKNYYFGKGEWRMVQVPDHAQGGVREIRLECVEFQSGKVIVKVGDKPEKRELKLPPRPSN